MGTRSSWCTLVQAHSTKPHALPPSLPTRGSVGPLGRVPERRTSPRAVPRPSTPPHVPWLRRAPIHDALQWLRHAFIPSHPATRRTASHFRLNRSHDTQQRTEGVSSPKGDEVGERRWKRSRRHAYKRAWTDENEEKEGQRNRQESKGWIVRRALRSPRVSTETPRCHVGACKLESHACVK